MKAPKCRLCEKNHWGLCERLAEKVSVVKGLREKVANIKPVVVHKEELVVHGPEMVVHTKHGKYADLEKRKSYRKEWMRRRRAEKAI